MIDKTKTWYAIRMAKGGKDDAAISRATGLSIPEIDKILRKAGLK